MLIQILTKLVAKHTSQVFFKWNSLLHFNQMICRLMIKSMKLIRQGHLIVFKILMMSQNLDGL